ncbi:MAG: hypothetical protein U9R79_09810 [Armatimonadota bacterium]|nr:hypothetical protein [Armatimonadota bacterium]
MTLSEFCERSVQMGIDADVRGRRAIEAELSALERAYRQMPTAAALGFDEERLRNPFGDTRLVYGDPETELTGFVTGIDISKEAFDLVERLRSEGERVDAIISHHTSGWGLRAIEDVLSAQFHRIVDSGVPEERAKRLMDEFATTKWQGWSRDDKLQLAGERDIPVALVHTPADNCHLAHTLQVMEARRPETLGQAVEALSETPEMGRMEGRGDGVRIVVGEPQRALGKVFCAMGCGWNPSGEVLAALGEAGVTTGLMVTPGAPLAEAARQAGMAIIGMPHEGQDSLGMSILYSRVIGDEDITIYPCGGYLMRQEHFAG